MERWGGGLSWGGPSGKCECLGEGMVGGKKGAMT